MIEAAQTKQSRQKEASQGKPRPENTTQEDKKIPQRYGQATQNTTKKKAQRKTKPKYQRRKFSQPAKKNPFQTPTPQDPKPTRTKTSPRKNTKKKKRSWVIPPKKQNLIFDEQSSAHSLSAAFIQTPQFQHFEQLRRIKTPTSRARRTGAKPATGSATSSRGHRRAGATRTSTALGHRGRSKQSRAGRDSRNNRSRRWGRSVRRCTNA